MRRHCLTTIHRGSDSIPYDWGEEVSDALNNRTYFANGYTLFTDTSEYVFTSKYEQVTSLRLEGYS